MAVESDTSLPLTGGRAVDRIDFRSCATNDMSPLTADVVKRLSGDGPRFVAFAPGRLNVMGGLSDYTGALVLHMPLAAHVCVGVQRRPDPVVSVVYSEPSTSAESNSDVPLSRIYTPQNGWVDPDLAQGFLNGPQPLALRCAIGALVEGIKRGVLPPFADGLSIVVASTVSPANGEVSAVAAASLVAIGALLGATLEPQACVEVCHQVETTWLKTFSGPADAICALLATPASLLEIHTDTLHCEVGVPLSDGFELIGVHCAESDADRHKKYMEVATATAIGRTLIERIIAYDRPPGCPGGGHFSHISTADYVEHFRDRLPAKLKGKDFIEKLRDFDDPRTPVQPLTVYKVRSRTEHHIYENSRARLFLDAVGQLLSESLDQTRKKIDDLMTASHWSYGQRCGLGDPSSDVLVKLIQEGCKALDIYGAKITGRGGGGLSCVALKRSDRAFASLNASLETFFARTGRRASLLRSGSVAGALVSGARAC